MSGAGSGAPHARTALVVGPPTLLAEAVRAVLQSLEVMVVDPSAPGPPPGPDLAVLVDPDDAAWGAGGDSRVVVITTTQIDAGAQLDLMVRGADAVVAAECPQADLAHALSTVVDGGLAISADVAGLAVERLRSSHRPPAIQLTPRERDILASIAGGESVKQTAHRLGISAKTVENLQSRLYRKLGARNRAQAVAVAHRAGLLTDDLVVDLRHDQDGDAGAGDGGG